MNPSNEADDTAVLCEIRAGACRAADIAREAGFAGTGANRRVDRALKRLKRRGKVRFHSSVGWSEVK